MTVPTAIDTNSPCFNINVGQLGSAPPYRLNSKTMTTEATRLPKLSGHWSPADSRIHHKIDSYNKIYYGGTITPRKSTASPKKSRVSEHKLVERQKTITTSITARSNHRNKDTITMKRLLALNGKIQDQQPTTLQIDKLKVQGVGVNGPIQKSPTKLQTDRNTKKIIGNEIVSPLLNASRDDHVQSVQYRKLLNRNSFLSAKHPTQMNNKTMTKPKLEARHSLDEKELAERRRLSDENTLLTISEYLRRENARYTKEEESVKKILFQNWLRNIQIVMVKDGGFDDDKASVDCSVFDLPIEQE